MGYYFKETTVFEEALNRIRLIFDTHDDVIVSMSGGKDSTVMFNLALMVAREKGRLPLKVFWLDQEAEWQHTVDYMDGIMRMPEVKPLWCQFPFDFTNSLSPVNNFIRIWDENKRDLWIHPQSDISIKENPCKYNRFHEIVKHVTNYFTDSDNTASLVGMRISESLNRRAAIVHGNSDFMGITWCSKKLGKIRTFWPIYDFNDDDIWTAIAKNHWEYNKVYDIMYRWGVAKTNMRVSALIHETAYHSIEMLQEFEPKTYNRFVNRINGVSTFNHAYDERMVIPRELPIMFKDWREYRDYLLVNLIKPEYWELFRHRWENQNTEEWYRTHVKEIILNDIDGTNNSNQAAKMSKRRKIGKNTADTNVWQMRDKALFDKYMEEKKNGN